MVWSSVSANLESKPAPAQSNSENKKTSVTQTSKDTPIKKSSKPPKVQGVRAGAFRKSLSPDTGSSRSDLFQKRSPRAGAASSNPSKLSPQQESVSPQKSSSPKPKARSSAFRKAALSEQVTGEEPKKSKNTKGRGADAFRRRKK